MIPFALLKQIKLPIQPANDYGELVLYSIVFLFATYLAMMCLAACRRIWGLFGQRENITITVHEYDSRSKKDVKEVLSYHKEFHSRVMCFLPHKEIGYWKLELYPANRDELIFVDDIAYHKTPTENEPFRLAYLVALFNQVWRPINGNSSYHVPKERLKKQDDIKICCAPPGEKKNTYYSLKAEFTPRKNNKVLKTLLYDALDFKEHGASRIEKIAKVVLVSALLIHMTWLATDVFAFANGGGNIFDYNWINATPLSIWPFVLRRGRSTVRILADFMRTMSAVPMDHIFRNPANTN